MDVGGLKDRDKPGNGIVVPVGVSFDRLWHRLSRRRSWGPQVAAGATAGRKDRSRAAANGAQDGGKAREASLGEGWRSPRPVLSDAPVARSLRPPVLSDAAKRSWFHCGLRQSVLATGLCGLALVPSSTSEFHAGLQRPVNEESVSLGTVATVLVPGGRAGLGLDVADLRVDRFEVTNEHYARWMNSERTRLSLVQNDRIGAIDVYHEDWGRVAAVKPHGRTSYGAMGLQVAERPGLADTQERALWFSPVADEEALPVRYVSWSGAAAYCGAIGGRLPTAVEWEHLAGVNRRESTWRAALAGSSCEGIVAGRSSGGECEAREWRPQRVGSALLDSSPDGVVDVAGNLAEWTSSRFEPAGRGTVRCLRAEDSEQSLATCRVIKGGDYATPLARVRLKARQGAAEDLLGARIGFRCVKDSTL